VRAPASGVPFRRQQSPVRVALVGARVKRLVARSSGVLPRSAPQMRQTQKVILAHLLSRLGIAASRPLAIGAPRPAGLRLHCFARHETARAQTPNRRAGAARLSWLGSHMPGHSEADRSQTPIMKLGSFDPHHVTGRVALPRSEAAAGMRRGDPRQAGRQISVQAWATKQTEHRKTKRRRPRN
jgi:hypothetical protein